MNKRRIFKMTTLIMAAALLLGACAGSRDSRNDSAGGKTEEAAAETTIAAQNASGGEEVSETADAAMPDAADAATEAAAAYEEAAAESESDAPPVWEISPAGLDIPLPASWIEAEYPISCDYYEMTDGMIMTYAVLYDCPKTEFEAAAEQYGNSPELAQYVGERVNDLFLIMSVEGSPTADQIKELLAKNSEESVRATLGVEEIGQADGWTFFSITGDKVLRRPPYQPGTEETMERILGELPGVFTTIRFYKPAGEPKIEPGTKISFETTDFEGNPVSSEELFAANKYTMVNIWMSWCTYCIQEMPDLEKLSKKFAEDGCGVIGVMLDGDQEEELETGRKMLAGSGATYVNLIPTDEMKAQLVTNAYPTTIFVDSEGYVACDPIVGMDPGGYEKQMEQLLEAYGKAEKAAKAKDGSSNVPQDQIPENSEVQDRIPESTAAGDSAVSSVYKDSESEDGRYHVRVINKAGEPVSGAMIQFCSDTFCMMGKTKADGIASWDAEAGRYEIHVNRVPQGYADIEEVIPAPEEPGTVTITLSKEKQ